MNRKMKFFALFTAVASVAVGIVLAERAGLAQRESKATTERAASAFPGRNHLNGMRNAQSGASIRDRKDEIRQAEASRDQIVASHDKDGSGGLDRYEQAAAIAEVLRQQRESRQIETPGLRKPDIDGDEKESSNVR